MDKKTMIIMGGIFIGALMVGVAIAPQKKDALPVPMTDDGMITMKVIAVHDDTNRLYRVDMEYPQFNGEAQGVSGLIAAYVDEELKNFKTVAEENWKARQDTTPIGQVAEEYPATPFTFSAKWTPKQINKKYISLIVRIDSYEGGANGRSELKTFNYDVSARKMLELEEFFPTEKAYLGKVAAYAYERLIESLRESSGGVVDINMVAEGTAPTKDNFKNFVFDENAIELYFPKYQVAPGAAGEQRVFIPRQGVW